MWWVAEMGTRRLWQFVYFHTFIAAGWDYFCGAGVVTVVTAGVSFAEGVGFACGAGVVGCVGVAADCVGVGCSAFGAAVGVAAAGLGRGRGEGEDGDVGGVVAEFEVEGGAVGGGGDGEGGVGEAVWGRRWGWRSLWRR